MAISYRHGISILELIFYTPAIFVALLLAFRHGFRKSSGWYYFIIFSLARIVGSCCYLATISYPTSTDLYIAYAVCSSVGVGPLLHANTGLLSRMLVFEPMLPIHPTLLYETTKANDAPP